MVVLNVSKLNTKVYNPTHIKDKHTQRYQSQKSQKKKRRITETIIRSFNPLVADS